jgi:hypothetical protein
MVFYKKMVELDSSQKIPYHQLYNKYKQKNESLLKKTEDDKLLRDYVMRAILVTLLLNLLLNTIVFFKSKSS